MAELRIPEPSEKQCLFMADRHKYIGYGGARGGGKSWAVRVKAVLLCLRYAGIKVMIIRKTYPELQENHIIPLCEMGIGVLSFFISGSSAKYTSFIETTRSTLLFFPMKLFLT